jgi:type VI secretion system secreted protein Hcp
MRTRLTRNRPVLVGMLSSVILTLLLAMVFIPGHSARAAASTPAAAGIDIFAKIDTIQGDSTNSKFAKQIPVQGFSFASTSSAPTGAGAGAGKSIASPITFTAAAGSDSPYLLKALAQGTHLQTAVFSFARAGNSPAAFQTYTLSNCSIIGFHQLVQQNGVVGDEVQITFTKVIYKFSPQKPDGSLAPPITVTWDIQTNQAA